MEGTWSGGAGSPTHKGGIVLKVGVAFGVMVIDMEVVVTHVPPDGVKV